MLESFVMLAVLDTILPIFVVVVGIGFLIFVHELGHFAVAKWNKVRVEAFSLGFGPVIWGFWKGETHYRLSLIPLGGYVKMAGETAADEHSDDPAEFLNKPILVRAAVLIAGVAMNMIVGIALFMVAFNIGVPLIVPVAGGVVPGSAADRAGIQPGDRILEVDGTRVIDFYDVIQEIAYASGAVDILIERNGSEILLEAVEPTKDPSGLIQRIGIRPPFEKGVQVDPTGPAGESGLASGDDIVAVAGIRTADPNLIEYRMGVTPIPVPITVVRDGKELTIPVTPRLVQDGEPLAGVSPATRVVDVVWWGERWEKIGLKPGDEFTAVNGERARTIEHARALAQAAAPEPVVFTVLRDGKEVALREVSGVGTAAEWREWFDQIRPRMPSLATTRLTLVDDRSFEDGNPARKAGLPEGAEILEVGGRPVKDWNEVRREIHRTASDEPVQITFRVDEEEPRSISVQRRRQVTRLYGVSFEQKTEIVKRSGIAGSIGAGLRRSFHTGLGILRMLGGIFTGKVSAKALGGPVMIAQISYSTAKKDFIHFLYFLGILSINLAILNILPIPVLDGGHLLFLLIEAVRRKPLPERAMGMFQWAGFLFLILVMVFVIFNDFQRILG